MNLLATVPTLIIINLLAVCLFSGCEHLKYQDDVGFKTNDGELFTSARANSPEFPVYIGESICKDMDGIIGQCAKRWKEESPFTFRVPARDYGYTLTVQCSSWVKFINDMPTPFTVDVLKGKEFIGTIDYGTGNWFQCIGEVFPKDRKDDISAKFRFGVSVVKEGYLPREVVYQLRYKKNDLLVLGEHSLHATIDGRNKFKETIYKYKQEPKCVYTESYSMRFNQYGCE